MSNASPNYQLCAEMMKVGCAMQWAGRMMAPFLLMVCLWMLACRFSGINSALLPTPAKVGVAFAELCAAGVLLGDVLWSLRRAVGGLLLGGALGLLIGTLTGRIGMLNWLLAPVFNGFRALPPVAIVPLVVV